MTETKIQSDKLLKASRFCLISLVFLLPFWFLPIAGFNLAMSKSLLVYFLTLASLIFYLMYSLQEGKLRLPKSFFMLALLGIVLVSLVSALFSGQVSFSLFGTGGEVGTFSFILFLALILFLTIQLFQNENSMLTALFLIMFSSMVLFILQTAHSLFGFFPKGIFANKLDALPGLWSELGIFFGFVALISVICLEFFSARLSKLDLGNTWRLLLYLVLFVSLLVMLIVNFTLAWIVFGSCVLIFFVYLFSSFTSSTNLVRLSLFMILISLFFILANSLVGDFVGSLGFSSFEVRPSVSATVDVVKETLGAGIKNMVIGSGPNTFIFNWDKFKPIDINQTIFWSTRFQNGFGFILSFAATLGLLGLVIWFLFLALFIYRGISSVGITVPEPTKTLLFASFLGAVYLWVFNIIYVPSHYLLTLSFFVTGLFFALFIKTGKISLKEISIIKSNSSFGFISALTIIFLLIGSIAGFYLIFQKYWANYSYAKGFNYANEEGNLTLAQEYLLKAAQFDKQPRYFRSLSELGVMRISFLVNQEQNLSAEERLSQLQGFLAFAIQNAQTATKLNPSDMLNWMALGQVYENLIPLQINGAREAALDAYLKASEESPSDPRPFLASARVEIQYGDNLSARNFLNSALQKKGNYTPALFLLSHIESQEGNLDNAIEQAELARLSAPQDVGVLFQLGLLYYQKEDHKKAQLALESAVNISPIYSNARYFLGLAYDKQGLKEKAIEQFEIIEQYNPGNAEVERILSNLRSGRSALSDISPPEPAPEERKELPIEEE